MSDDTVTVRCPYCREQVELYVDPDTTGSFIEDCEVCCRPWEVTVAYADDGTADVAVLPADGE